MDNLLRRVESEEVVIYKEHVYSFDLQKKCRDIHKQAKTEKKIEGEFDDDKWMGYSGVKKFGMDFSMDVSRYNSHIGKEFAISFDTMKNMVKCYAIYCYGIYVFNTISRDKIKVVKEFLQRFRDKDFRLTNAEITTIEEFLSFIETPYKQIEEIISLIKIADSTEGGQRKLSSIINYLVIAEEINNIFKEGCDRKTFIKWFPIYFWVNITFILPLRATEMLVTPINCIQRERGKVFLCVRRTQLKKGKRTVSYDIDKDYKLFSYEMPETETVRNIEKYILLTESQKRRFLFKYDANMINEMISLPAFNHLIQEFVNKHIINNSKYDFAKYATGIKDYEPVTAGDSRPIAMANLYFQKAGEDICRQLADHVHINTSSGYYSNVSETIWASSIIHLQRKLDYVRRQNNNWYKQGKAEIVDTDSSVCVSERRVQNRENLDDCIEQGHLEDCMGCKYYRPTKAELDDFLNRQKEKADKSAKRVIEFMNNTMSIKNKNTSLEEVFLAVQTDATRYRMGCEIKAKEVFEEWRERKNIQKTN